MTRTAQYVAVVDASGSNLASVAQALRRLEVDFELTTEPERIRNAARVILPGVGAAPEAMRRLEAAGLPDVLRSLTQPVLGICMGMQLLFASSSEGAGDGEGVPMLGVIPGRVERMRSSATCRVPHMGWNVVRATSVEGERLLVGTAKDDCFYFVHSYAAADGPWVAAHSVHAETLPAIVAWKNFYGVQFHPEKSARAGATLLRNFVLS